VTSPAPADYLAAGSRLLDRFTVLREIGRGGFSIVYAAHDDRVGADIALKLLVPPPAVAQQARERMRREVRAVRGLAHRHIVQVHDFVEDGPRSFVVMELIDGPDLAVRVRDRGALRAEEAARIGAAIAGALSLAHARGILHRDVKPSNILLDGGRACLTDFGSARLQGAVSMTQTGGIPGTIDYLAPELLGGARADARADIYALGLTLHVAVTGQLPKRPSPMLPPPALAGGHRPGLLRPDLPAWLDAIVARATAARPSDRFATAELLAEALIAGDAAVLPAGRSIAVATARCASCATEEAGPSGLCAACLLSRRWAPLPRSLYVVAAGMVAAGAAASSVAPPLLAASPVLAGLLLAAGQRTVRGRSRLPRRARLRIARAMGALRPGAARRLLVDVVTASDAVYPAFRRVAGSRAPSDVMAFLDHACGAARELAEVDELLATLEQGREDLGAATGTWNDAVAVTEQRRDALVQRLLDTMARLARMAQHSVQSGASSAGQLEAMGVELETAMREHAEAMREVEEVLKPLR
jgi:serine/threonine-protein kinase